MHVENRLRCEAAASKPVEQIHAKALSMMPIN